MAAGLIVCVARLLIISNDRYVMHCAAHDAPIDSTRPPNRKM